MVRAVNRLRAMGKEQALAALRNHLRTVGTTGDPMQGKKVLLVCRLLFANPAGWHAPRLGHPEPDVDLRTAERFPLFPIAVSRGVPFLLVRGYASGGRSEDTPQKCVEFCEGLSLITADLREEGFQKAAGDLIKTDLFQGLYLDPKSKREATEMIMRQAESAPAQER
jgi:hypothetical protein